MNYFLRNSYMHLSQVDMFSVGVAYQPIVKNKLSRILCVFALIKNNAKCIALNVCPSLN